MSHSALRDPNQPNSPLLPQHPPMPTNRIFPATPPHSPARFARRQFHPIAASQETTPLPARSPLSAFRAAPPPTVHSAPQSRKPPHPEHSPTAPSPKTNAPPPQIRSTALC